MTAEQALERFMAALPPKAKVLDIGSGDGEHADIMTARGFKVSTIDLGVRFAKRPMLTADYNRFQFGNACFDGIWSAHCLEHQANPGLFLAKTFKELRPGGLLCITVPPMKPELVGGHLTLWTPALLIYHLVLAGYDCRKARIGVYDYNISVLVPHVAATLPPNLAHDNGDIAKLAHLFPVPVQEGANGLFANHNW